MQLFSLFRRVPCPHEYKEFTERRTVIGADSGERHRWEREDKWTVKQCVLCGEICNEKLTKKGEWCREVVYHSTW